MTTNSTADPFVGHVLDGRYEIIEKSARGGMATVYRAHDRRLGRVVAVKIMHKDLNGASDEEYAEKFDHEARAAAALTDPNVVAVFDQGEERGRPYIVMEFVEGATLRNVISTDAPLPTSKAFALIESVAAALAAAHDSGLVHRDVKPENVLISTAGKVKVADFGLALALNTDLAATQGLLIGTVSYIAPERVLGARADERSDIYSAGVMLYEMLTGRKPYIYPEPMQVALAHTRNDIPPPSELAPGGVPDYVDALVLACTRREPSLRPRDGRDLLARVKRVRKALAERTASDPALAAIVGGARPVGGRPAAEWTPVAPASGSPRATPATHASPVDFNENSEDLAELVAPRSQRTPVFPDISHDVVHKRRRRIVGVVFLLIIAAIAGAFAWWHFEGRYTSVPVVVGHTETDAIRLARANQLTISFDREYSETVAAGEVIRTDPEGGARVLKKTQMHAIISLGPERYAVPTLVGLTRAEAEGELLKANLVAGPVTEDFSEDVETGRVISASIAPDVMVKKGTPVDLVISLGPKPRPITNYVGRPLDEAKAAFEGVQLVVEVTEANSHTVPSGIIMAQDPVEGELPRGGTVKITVSIGPRMVQVPAVTWRSVDVAKQILEDAGFKVTVADPNASVLGIVRSTDPDSSQTVPEGSTITLYLI